MDTTGRKRRNLVVPLAIILFLAAAFVGWVLYPSCNPYMSRGKMIALIVCCGIPVVPALYLLIARPLVTVIHLAAFLFIGLITTLIGALLLQLVLRQSVVRSGWRSPAPPEERNGLGFRGRPIQYTDNDKVVVLLGDSQVEATALSFDAIPERVLESHLDVAPKTARVFTVGTWGYGQDQELLALEEFYKQYRADLVVLWETPANDVWNNVFSTHMYSCTPKPTFWLENGVLRGPTESFEQPIASSPIVIVALWQRVFTLRHREPNWDRKLPKPYSPMTRYSGPVRTDYQERWDNNYGSMKGENFATERTHMGLMFTPPSERTKYGAQLTHALIERINQVVRGHNGRLVVFEVQHPPLPKPEEGVFVLNGKYYNISRRQMESIWQDINKGFDSETVPVTVENWRVGPEDAHLNKAATDQVMADLAARLKPRLTGATVAAGLN